MFPVGREDHWTRNTDTCLLVAQMHSVVSFLATGKQSVNHMDTLHLGHCRLAI